MIWLAFYLYVIGTVVTWWGIRAACVGKPAKSYEKLLAVALWPIVVPIAALWW